MTLRDSTHLLRKLNPHCASALADAASLCNARLHGEITSEHWLLKLIESGDGDIPAILRHYEIDIDTVWDALLASLERPPRELRGKPALSRTLAEILEGAWLHASAGGDMPTIRSSHVLQALVDAPHCLRATDAWPLLSISAAQIQRLTAVIDGHSVEARDDTTGGTAGKDSRVRTTVTEDGARSDASTKPQLHARAKQLESQALARFTIDLTAKAHDGKIDPVFGRDVEIQQIVDILARRRKNNPILVGEPGVGKTALVEGLALRIAEGDPCRT